MQKLLLLLACCCAIVATATAQNFPVVKLGCFPFDTLRGGKPVKVVLRHATSKRNDVNYFIVPVIEIAEQEDTVAKTVNRPPAKRVQFLKVSGNILYDVNYRSRIDTPYADKDVYQHTLQTRLDLVYKEQYPFRMYVTTRFSNSSLFRKYTDLNLQFNQLDFKRSVKQKVMDAVQSYLAAKSYKQDSLRRLIEAKRITIADLDRQLQMPDWKQKMVAEREKLLFEMRKRLLFPGGKPDTAMLNSKVRDSVETALLKQVDARTDTVEARIKKYKDSIAVKKQKLDSLRKELQAIDSLYHKLTANDQKNITELKKALDDAKDVGAIEEKLNQLQIPDTVLPKGYKTLYSIKSLSIGRSVANYSELTVKNISITGIQAEFNPRYYYAVAIGKIDYRFRDYIVPNSSRTSQYVALVRLGKGQINGNHIIFTYYTGKRQFFNASIATQPNSAIPEYNLAGLSVEGMYKINKNVSVVGEIAKSTIPYYSLDSLQKKNWMSSVARFSERSNEAASVKLFSFFPKTATRFSGNLRYLAANFQSFSTFTTGAAQLSWQAKLEQPFFKKKALTIITSLQQNDYNNPFVTTNYKSSSLLASFQANLRLKKWPVISLGYFPSYQLTKTGDDQYTESRYYALTGSAGYYYHINGAMVSTYAVYSRFYNEMNDSGFVYYNSKNVLLSQSVTYNKLSVLLNVSLSNGTDYNMYTVENNVQFSFNKIVSAGAGVKMINYSLLPQVQWGYNANVAVKVPRLGDIQLMADKGYLPGINKQLVQNNMGRLTYFKTF